MKKLNKHIEIARTEYSQFSSMSAKSCRMIQEVLRDHFEHVGVSIINNQIDLELLASKQPDLVFLGLKRLPTPWRQGGTASDDDVWLSEFLDHKGIRYTGSSKAAIQLDFSKDRAKILVANAGLPTARFFTAMPGQYTDAASLPMQFPLFLKPLHAGGGKGIGDDSVVRNFSAFRQKVEAIFVEFGSSALVEEYLTGREFSVAILENGYDDELIVLPVEITTESNSHGDRILGSQIKVADTERVIAISDQRTRAMIANLARNVYRVLGVRDLGRIDIRMDSAGKPHFLEANLVPGLGTGYFGRACRINTDMDYEGMILSVARLGLARNMTVTPFIAV